MRFAHLLDHCSSSLEKDNLFAVSTESTGRLSCLKGRGLRVQTRFCKVSILSTVRIKVTDRCVMSFVAPKRGLAFSCNMAYTETVETPTTCLESLLTFCRLSNSSAA